MTREELGKLKIRIRQRDFATSSDDWLNGFRAGTEAALDAVAEEMSRPDVNVGTDSRPHTAGR